MQSAQWPALESDPAIFTEYFQKLGMPQTFQFVELLGFDPELLAFCAQPIYGLAVVYQDTGQKLNFSNEPVKDLYFMKQTEELDNACGLIAGMHILGNLNIPFIPDSPLQKFFNAYENNKAAMTPLALAEALANNQEWKDQHRNFTQQGQSSNERDCRHHFIAFVKKEDKIYYFNGEEEAPQLVKTTSAETSFLEEAVEIVQKAVNEGVIHEHLNMMILN